MSLSVSGKTASTLLPICLLIVAMVSIQSGASLAKSLFPLVGAEGITTLRLGFGTLILFIIFRPWRMRFAAGSRLPLLIYGLALGSMNYLFYLSLRTLPLGIAVALEFTGPWWSLCSHRADRSTFVGRVSDNWPVVPTPAGP